MQIPDPINITSRKTKYNAAAKNGSTVMFEMNLKKDITSIVLYFGDNIAIENILANSTKAHTIAFYKKSLDLKSKTIIDDIFNLMM